MSGRAAATRLALLAPLCLALIAATAWLGPTSLGWHDARFWELRVPRTCLAAVAGAGLAVGGAIFQSLFRNPLATPYTLGIASGASLSAAVGFMHGIRGFWELPGGMGFPRLSLLAFGGAVAAMGLIYGLARLRGGRDLTQLLLGGVCVAYLCSAGILLATYLADRPVTNEIVIWMMGALTVLGWGPSVSITIVLVPVLAYALVSHRAIDLLTLGDDLAASRGVAVTRTVWTTFALVGVLTAVIVGNCGPIGFVGLIVPHLVRGLVGPAALSLLIGSALAGGGFLALCDGIARAITVRELPVGVMTNIIGAAFFFYLLAMRRGGARSAG